MKNYFVYFLCILGVVYALNVYNSKKRVIITIQKIENVTTAQTGERYLIYSTKGGIYENSTNMFYWLLGKKSVAKMQRKLKVNSTYEIELMGVEIEEFQTYENILKVRKIQ